LLPLEIQYLEGYFPNICYIIALTFLAKVPGHCARKERNWIECFSFLVDCLVEIPVTMTRIFSKFNRIVLMA